MITCVRQANLKARCSNQCVLFPFKIYARKKQRKQRNLLKESGAVINRSLRLPLLMNNLLLYHPCPLRFPAIKRKGKLLLDTLTMKVFQRKKLLHHQLCWKRYPWKETYQTKEEESCDALLVFVLLYGSF